MPQIIPLEPSVAYYQFGTTLDQTPCIFDVHWNSVDEAWYFDILDTEEVPIIHGVKIVLGVHLGRRSTHAIFQQGVLVASDLSGKGIDATYDDIGQRVELRYYTNFEVVATLKQQGVG